MKSSGTADEFGIDILHVGLGFRVHIRMRRQRAAVRDGLLADLAPARIHGRVIDAGGLGVHDIARAETFTESGSLRIIIRIGLLHGVEVVEDAVELVEAVDRGQVFIAVAQDGSCRSAPWRNPAV